MARLDDARAVTDSVANHVSDHNALHRKANYVYDVKDYGAAGDGSTDDKTAVSDAITAALSNLPAVVYFPAGDYSMSGGILVRPAQGSSGLTFLGEGATASRLIFDKGSALSGGEQIMLSVAPSSTPSVGSYDDYLHRVSVRDLGFYDNDPATHADTEESHAVSIQYAVDASIVRCSGDSIGDETFNFSYVRGGQIVDCHVKNSPSVGTLSGAITIQHGSADILVAGNTILGSSTFGTQSTVSSASGVHIEIINADAIEGVRVTDNTIRDFAHGGVWTSISAAASVTDVVIANNTIDNCDYGHVQSGSGAALSNYVISDNTFRDIQEVAISFPAGKSLTDGASITGNMFESCACVTLLTASNIQIANNVVKNCTRGHYLYDVDDVSVIGDLFDNTGKEVEVLTGSDSMVSSLYIRNSASTGACIKRARDVFNCVIQNSSASSPELCISDATNVVGNRITGGGIRLLSSAVNGIVANNVAGFAETGTANTTPCLWVGAGNDGYTVTGNSFDMSSATNNQYCVDIASGATGTMLVGNYLRSKTAGSSNALNDNGTSTLADLTYSNVTS